MKSVLQPLFSSTRATLKWKPGLLLHASCVFLLKMNTCWADVRCPTCQSWGLRLTLSGCHMAPWHLLVWDWKSRCNRPIPCVMTLCRRTGWGKAATLHHWDKVGQSPSEHHCRFVWTGPCFLSLLLGSTLSCAATPKILLTLRWWQGHTSRPAYLWPTFHRPWTFKFKFSLDFSWR